MMFKLLPRWEYDSLIQQSKELTQLKIEACNQKTEALRLKREGEAKAFYDALPPFVAVSPCPKCACANSEFKHKWYSNVASSMWGLSIEWTSKVEYLERTCYRCGWHWNERTADAEVTPDA